MTSEPRIEPTPTTLSRRTMLVAGAGLAGAFLLGGCGSDEKSSAPDSDDKTGATGASSLSLVAFFDGRGVLGPQRLERVAFGLGDRDGALMVDGPDELVFQLSRDGKEVGDPITAPRRAEGLERAYYPMVFTVDAAGFYEVGVSGADDPVQPASFEVSATKDLVVPAAGDPMPIVDTPTLAEARGVVPICTADPVCELHDINLSQALADGRPVALLISTPAFCQTAICGPVLDLLVSEHEAFAPKIDFIHAEVYRNGKEAQEKGASAETTAAVQAMSLPFEPSLVLIGADGKIAARLDTIYDKVELREALTELAG